MSVHYVYRFLNMKHQVIYVGETNDINRRIREHLSCNPSKTSFKRSDLKYISRVEYLKLRSVEQGKLVEKYYIMKYLSPVLKNKVIPSKHVKIKNPPSNWRTFIVINKQCKKVGRFKFVVWKIFMYLILGLIIIYYII